MNRPTCGTCPHRVRYRDSYGCARETPRGVVVGDTVLAAAPYVPPDYPGCQHHPAMGSWLESLEEPAAQPAAASKPQHYGYRQPGKTLADELAELSVVREWLASLPYPSPGETLAERLGNLSAEREQWRRTIVWLHCRGGSMYSLQIVWSGVILSEVTLIGDWVVGRGGQPYPSRDAAMRAAEDALGLPRCRVEGEL